MKEAQRVHNLIDELMFYLKRDGEVNLMRYSNKIEACLKYIDYNGNLDQFRIYVFDVLCAHIETDEKFKVMVSKNTYNIKIHEADYAKLKRLKKAQGKILKTIPTMWCSQCKQDKAPSKFYKSKKTRKLITPCQTCPLRTAAEKKKKTKEKENLWIPAKPGALPSGKVYDEHFKPNFVKSPGVIYKILKFLKLLK